MDKKYKSLGWLLWPILSLTLVTSAILADDCPTAIKPVTNGDSQVPVKILAFLVKPLTKCELEVEAKAWMLSLSAKVREISNAEVAEIYKKDEIEKAEELESAQKHTKEAVEESKQARENADIGEIKEASDDAKEAMVETKAALKESKLSEQKLADNVQYQFSHHGNEQVLTAL